MLVAMGANSAVQWAIVLALFALVAVAVVLYVRPRG